MTTEQSQEERRAKAAAMTKRAADQQKEIEEAKRLVNNFNNEPASILGEGMSTAEIAKFLQKNFQTINPYALGGFLQDRTELQQKYENHADYKSRSLHSALKMHLLSYPLQGDYKNLESRLKMFSEAYVSKETKSPVYRDLSAEQVFNASIGLMALNNNLQNSEQDKKMDEKQFLRYMKDMKSGIDNEEILKDIYKQTVSSLIPVPEKTMPGFNISYEKKNKPNFRKIHNIFNKNPEQAKAALKKIMPDIQDVAVTKSKGFFGRITGYNGEMAVTAKNDKGEQTNFTIQYYMPGIFSSKAPKLLISPEANKYFEGKDASIRVAANMAFRLNSPAPSRKIKLETIGPATETKMLEAIKIAEKTSHSLQKKLSFVEKYLLRKKPKSVEANITSPKQ